MDVYLPGTQPNVRTINLDIHFPPNTADKGSHSCVVKTLKIRLRAENLNGTYPSPNYARDLLLLLLLLAMVLVVVVIVLVLLFLFTPLCRLSSLFRPHIFIQSFSRSSSVSTPSLIKLYNPFRDSFICHSIQMVWTMLSSCYFVLILFYTLSQCPILNMNHADGFQPVVRERLGGWRKNINYDALLNVLLLHVKQILVRFATASFWETRTTIICNFPRHCILLEDGGTPSNEGIWWQRQQKLSGEGTLTAPLDSVTCRATMSHFGEVNLFFDALLSLFTNATFLLWGGD